MKTLNKDTVFLIGKTGVGKTTMVHLLSGRKIIIDKILIGKILINDF